MFIIFMVKESHRVLPINGPHPRDLLLVPVLMKLPQADTSSWAELSLRGCVSFLTEMGPCRLHQE